MSFVHTKEDIEAAARIAKGVADALGDCQTIGISLAALSNLLGSYLLASVEAGMLDPAGIDAVLCDFDIAVRHRIAQEPSPGVVH